MGNVLAASAPLAPPPKFDAPPASPDNAEISPPNAQEDKTTSNPGTVEDLHKKCKDVFPTNFEGAKLMINKGLSNNFQVTHTINMSAFSPSGYRFGTTYVGSKQISPQEVFPIIFGDIDTSGNLNAHVEHLFGERLKGKLMAQVMRNKYNAVQMTADYKGDSYTLSTTVANPDIINGSGITIFHYLQSITPSLALGGGLVYQRDVSGMLSQSVAVPSFVGRYTNGDSTVSASLGLNSCHICYYQRANQQVQLGVELNVDSRIQESTASVAYQVEIPQADLLFKGIVDSNWTVGGVLEKKLQPLPLSFALSGMINHTKNQFRLGMGFIVA